MHLVFEVVSFNSFNIMDCICEGRGQVEGGAGCGAEGEIKQTFGHKWQCCVTNRLAQLTG